MQQNAFLHTGLHMRLRKLKLKNFRGYRNSTEIIIDESMTGIVGRNDFGKST
ncbi:AAA family ATPase, partial [Citrobacter freundii]|uniref:AAA family ATPase n=1 Tax=Citrobacter freundii TaxID=546 RepID=UPI00292BFBD9|nr:AAA family ATPase [Citrobacter freundii]MEB0882377.1 AAA family ATPase [Citrobacter freundii]